LTPCLLRTSTQNSPSSRGKTMNVVSLKACKWCRLPMSNVAEIAPFGDDPGLVAFMCSHCGTIDSVLTCEGHQGARTQPLRIAFTCPRKLGYQLRDCRHKRCVTVASQHLRALQNDLDVKEIVNL